MRFNYVIESLIFREDVGYCIVLLQNESMVIHCQCFFILFAVKPVVEIKESKDSNSKVLKLDCIVMFKGKRVTSGVIWLDGKDKKMSANSHVEIALKPGANVAKCKYEVGGWSGSRTLTKFLQVSGGEGGDSSSSGKITHIGVYCR